MNKMYGSIQNICLLTFSYLKNTALLILGNMFLF